MLFAHVVLVLNVADDLLEQVLHRDDAGGAAVFVNHDRQRFACALQRDQDFIERRRFRKVTHRAHHLGDRAAHDGFDRVRLDGPELEVDTTDDYRPGLDEIVAFADAGR